VIISYRFPTCARTTNRQLWWAHLRRDFTAMIDLAAGGSLEALEPPPGRFVPGTGPRPGPES
jgi:hypothetical protein